MYARDDFVYWGFPLEGLQRLGRIVGLDELEVVDQREVGHPRILAVLRATRDGALRSASFRLPTTSRQARGAAPLVDRS